MEMSHEQPTICSLQLLPDEASPAHHPRLRRGVKMPHIHLSPRDSPRMYVKTAVLLLWFGASYALLVFAATTWWQGALLSFSLALAMAGIGTLYGFLIPKWHFVYDFKNVARARIARNRFPRPRGWSLVELIGGNAVFFGWALVVPALFHPWWVVLLYYYAGTSMVLGFVLSAIFQLAHGVEEADFPEPPPGANRLPDAWAVQP